MNVPKELRYTRSHEWIGVEDNVAIVGITDFAQQQRRILRPVPRIARGTAIAQGDIEVTIGPEVDVARIVVGVWLLDGEENILAVRVGDVGVTTHLEARDPGAPDLIRCVGIVHIEMAIARIVRVKGETQQSFFAGTGVYPSGDVQKGDGGDDTLGRYDLDRASLLDDEQPVVAGPGVGDAHRLAEPGGKGIEGQIEEWGRRLCPGWAR